MKILHHERKRLEGHFSIERLFAEIRRHMPDDCEVTSCPAPEASAGILPRWRNVRHAARLQADVHHIVGDSHYLAFGLPPKKTVLTIHDCGALNRLTGWKRALLKYFWFTGPMRRAAVVTTISQASKDELRKWVGPLADKVVVVPDCVFEDFTYNPKPFHEECPVVLQVGTKWNKNVERVMEAVAGLQPEGLTGRRGCRLEIVGTISADRHTAGGIRPEEGQGAGGGGQGTGGKRPTAYGRRHEAGEERGAGSGEQGAREPEAVAPEMAQRQTATEEWPRRGARGALQLEELTGRRDGEDLRLTNLKLKTTAGLPVVHELGRLTDLELVEAYRRCDMVVFASLYEGFGLPILEAQAMGRPVITSNFGAMKEAAGDGALLVDPYSVEAIREAILRITREPALREDLIAKGLRNVERFRAEAVALKYAEIYKNLAMD